MEFRIADTFTSSLARLENDEQKAVKTSAFDLQMNPAAPGLHLHKLDNARDKNFWSVRVNRDIRMIVHRTSDSLLLCYVAHHDDAYAWAEKRKVETHPTTGAAQLVEIREVFIDIPVERFVEAPPQVEVPKPALFAGKTEAELLSYGVPPEWLNDVLAANEDTLLSLADHLPGEAAEALLELATGGQPEPAAKPTPGADPFQHPDAQRRFRTIDNVEELERALDYPWDRWTIFLHPAQQALVERSYNGPARVAGSAGTGKTVVALHRAVFLARNDADARVLLTTFSDALANLLTAKLHLLVRSQPQLAERIDVKSMRKVGESLYRSQFGPFTLADDVTLRVMIAKSSQGSPFPVRFIESEWRDVVDAWQLKSWEEYRDVRRLGRKSRLREDQRASLWSIFEKMAGELTSLGVITTAEMFTKLAQAMPRRTNPPYQYVVVDEAQDVSVSQLRFLAALGGDRPNALFFAGDLGQRIFQSPFSWLAQGVDIRGRSRTLHINYRTSHQIRSQADRLLGREVTDVDGIVEERTSTISVFNGPPPEVQTFESPGDEISFVAGWLRRRIAEGMKPHEIAVFVRSINQTLRALKAVSQAGLEPAILDEEMESAEGQVTVATMHLAKGLEFKAVAVMACDDEIIPLQERLETASVGSELEDVYNTERNLLYVACTRSRDNLLLTSGGSRSEFLDDFMPQ